MITETTAQLICGQASRALDDQRALVLVNLCQARFSFDDITEALNCDDSLVRSLVAKPFRALSANSEANAGIGAPIDFSILKSVPGHVAIELGADGALLGREKEARAEYLAREIRQWLSTLEASDADRVRAVEEASIRLDESTHHQGNKYIFQVERVASDIRRAWQPFVPYGDRPFHIIVGRWLAAWVHFWVADPHIWNCAIDILLWDIGRDVKAA
jgi:hypothetical protein